MFLAARSDINPHLFDDVVPCLQFLRQQGVQTGIVSNGNAILVPLCCSASRSNDQDQSSSTPAPATVSSAVSDSTITISPSLESLISIYLNASQLGAMKPSLVPFLASAQLCNVPLARILFVGDHKENDVKGAQQAGMVAAWLQRSNLNSSVDGVCSSSIITSTGGGAEKTVNRHITLNSLDPQHFMSQVEEYLSPQ